MPPTILVVDDDPAARRRLREILQDEGYATMSAGSALEAMMAAASISQPVDVVLTKANLRGISGCALASKMEQAFPGTRVLYISESIEPGELLIGIRGALSTGTPHKMAASASSQASPHRETA